MHVKNLIVNIYKTLFFFDLAIVVAYYIPDIKTENSALLTLWREGVFLGVVLAFTLFFIKAVEKSRLRVFNFKNKLRHYSLGLITAVGGGMLRDMMARRMPVVLYMDVYAIASIVGGLVLCCLRHFTALELSVSSWIAFACVTLLRFCAIHFHWQLYHPHRKRRRQ